MDMSSVLSNALGGLLGSLALILLMDIGKRLRAIIKQKIAQPKEVLHEAILKSQEYQEILCRRKSFRSQGYVTLICFLCLLATVITAWVINGKIWVNFSDIGGTLSSIGLLISLPCFSSLALYSGYTPITSQEVEQKRQGKRQRTLKEALGARPYGYIFQDILFPVFFWLYFVCCAVLLALVLVFPPKLIHIPLTLVIPLIAFVAIASMYMTYLFIRKLHRSVNDLKNVPNMRQLELRQQLERDEFQ